ncbi:MAG: hypothetical protein ACFLMY_15005 [Candidatus Brachytrichaceae bacterium NZ_4S206]|jgi:hypothetical protein
MAIKFRGEVHSLHAQVALINKRFDPSLEEPEWITGNELCVVAPAGVYVATANDTHVLLTVQDDLSDTEQYMLGDGTMEVRSDGLIVGNIVAADTYELDWPSGLTRVRVYANSQIGLATRVNFVLG